MKCPYCSFLNSDYSYKCVKCGKELIAPQQQPLAPVNKNTQPIMPSQAPPAIPPNIPANPPKNSSKSNYSKYSKPYGTYSANPPNYNTQAHNFMRKPFFVRLIIGLFSNRRGLFRINFLAIIALLISFLSPYKMTTWFVAGIYGVIFLLSIVQAFASYKKSSIEVAGINIILRLLLIIIWFFSIFFNLR